MGFTCSVLGLQKAQYSWSSSSPLVCLSVFCSFSSSRSRQQLIWLFLIELGCSTEDLCTDLIACSSAPRDLKKLQAAVLLVRSSLSLLLVFLFLFVGDLIIDFAIRILNHGRSTHISLFHVSAGHTVLVDFISLNNHFSSNLCFF